MPPRDYDGDPRNNNDLVGDVATLKEAMRRMDDKVDTGFARYDGRFDSQDVVLRGIKSDIAGLRQIWAERSGVEKAAAALIAVLTTGICAVFGPTIIGWITSLIHPGAVPPGGH